MVWCRCSKSYRWSIPLTFSNVFRGYRNWTLAWNRSKVNLIENIYFFLSGFSFADKWQLTGQQGKGGDHLLFHSTTSTRSRIFRHLFVTLHVRWLSHNFNRSACIYQTANSMRFTTLSHYYLIDWWWDIDFCLIACWDDFRFLLQLFDMRNRWTRSRIDYHPCITSEQTNQVC